MWKLIFYKNFFVIFPYNFLLRKENSMIFAIGFIRYELFYLSDCISPKICRDTYILLLECIMFIGQQKRVNFLVPRAILILCKNLKIDFNIKKMSD